MNTLDELLEAVPGLRRLRSLDAKMLRILLDRKPRTCTWCGGRTKGRRSLWCRDECVEAFKSRCCWQDVRDRVEIRDKGVCAKCGRDTRAAEAESKQSGVRTNPYQKPGESSTDFLVRQRQNEEALAKLGYARGHWREVDHDPPIEEYGGLCKIEDLKTLCGVCHLGACRQHAARRAANDKK